LKIDFSSKISLDVPVLETETKEYALNYDLGIDFLGYYSGVNEVLAFFADTRIGYIWGNKLFYKNILKDDKQGFIFGQ